MQKLWVEHHRPATLDGYVFRDESQKKQVRQWLESGTVPNLLFSGPAGTGKTTLAKALLNELNVDWGDVLFINASVTNGVDEVRNKIVNFSSSMPFGDFRYVILDEADYISPAGQAALRGVMEQYSNSCRFILTCNYPNKIIPALHSRCQGFHIQKLDRTEFTARLAEILIAEEIEVDLDTLDLYVRAAYPDMRKAINMMQQNSGDGKLNPPSSDENSSQDFRVNLVSMFRDGKIAEARKMIVKQATPEEYDGIYRFLYENLDLWGEDYDKQTQALMIIRNGLVNDTLVADREINLSACLAELEMLNS